MNGYLVLILGMAGFFVPMFALGYYLIYNLKRRSQIIYRQLVHFQYIFSLGGALVVSTIVSYLISEYIGNNAILVWTIFAAIYIGAYMALRSFAKSAFANWFIPFIQKPANPDGSYVKIPVSTGRVVLSLTLFALTIFVMLKIIMN